MNDWFFSFSLIILTILLGLLVGQILKNLSTRFPPVLSPVQPRRILVIGAHPDDLKMACGGTLARMYREGHLIHGLILSRTAQPHHPVENKKFIGGFDELTYLELPSKSLFGEMGHIYQAIEEKIRTFRPEIVLTPSEHDRHPDHQLIHYATLQAAQQVYTILCYESLTATADFKPNLFVEIDDYLDEKIENLRTQTALLVPSPMNGLDIYLQTHIRAHARIRGEQARTTYAEGFEIRRVLLMNGGAF